ncbi:replicative DNA helicase [Streptomyces sp. SID3343]|uniref:replicative DNA helicase n=1 Tax=Streptomyces sp. SID3343 TaxID=2690260 RepID=UPI00136EE874|nr:replicative DNA helicase [Streptomyces sp. SID3343]MYW00046.1 replicative DNA helicase [Streptomyces sp. SID3343]
MTVIPAPTSRDHDQDLDQDETLPGVPPMDRAAPQDIAAEQSALGAMLLSKDAIGDVVQALGKLGGTAFHRPAHELIYAAILDLYARDLPVNAVTVADEMGKRGEIGRVGGHPYLHTLISAVPTAANAEYFARIVLEKATLRRLVESGTRIVQMGFAGIGEVAEIVDAASAELATVTARTGDDEGSITLDGLFGLVMDEAERMQNEGARTGILTGYQDLDDLTHGLQPGQMVIVAARPSLGKSTLALDVARHAAIRGGHKVVFFSLEMTRQELGQRLIAAEARIPLHRIRGGQMTEQDWTAAARVAPACDTKMLEIVDSMDVTITQIKARCRRIKQRDGRLDLVVIDYLQLLQSSGRKPENRQVEVSELSRNVKLLAKELDVPVMVLSQLNRGPEGREDKMPRMSDLRESGSLEQDADLVILLHREDAYDPESARAGEVDLIVDKNRNGAKTKITVYNQLHYGRFVDANKRSD